MYLRQISFTGENTCQMNMSGFRASSYTELAPYPGDHVERSYLDSVSTRKVNVL